MDRDADLDSQIATLERELESINTFRSHLPHLLGLVDRELAALRAQRQARDTRGTAANSKGSPHSVTFSPTKKNPQRHGPAPQATPAPGFSLPRSKSAPAEAIEAAAAAASMLLPRRRIKIPVPAEKYPEYNFVGRLLGPRGTTLKMLEKNTQCKIMIRGKGSIRSDRESEVRGKPGWEHVFTDPLHVILEAEQVDEPAATMALNQAKEAVELLLVPVPEEQDNLKKQQLRDLAILNGTFRGGATSAVVPPTGAIGSSISRSNSRSSRTIDGEDFAMSRIRSMSVNGRRRVRSPPNPSSPETRPQTMAHSAKSMPRLSIDPQSLISPDDIHSASSIFEETESPSSDQLDFKAAGASVVRWMDEPTPRGDQMLGKSFFNSDGTATTVARGGLGNGQVHYNGAFAEGT